MSDETMNTAASDGAISTQAQHTPGPWRVEIGGGTVNGDRYTPVEPRYGLNSDFVICHCFGPDRNLNARLVAAAPDMLDALKIALHDYVMGDGIFPEHQIRDAIAKAEGRS